MKRKRRFGRLLAIAGLGLIVTGAAVLLLYSPRWYVATATVYLPIQQTGRSGSYEFELFLFRKELEMIQSPAVLSNAVTRLATQTAEPRLTCFTGLTTEQAITKLRSLCNACRVRSVRVLQIRASHEDPEAAAQIANAVVLAYCSLPAERQRQYTQDELAAIENWLRNQSGRATRSLELDDEAKAHLQAARQGKLVTRVETELVDPATPPTSCVTLGQRLDNSLGRARYQLPGPPPHPHFGLCAGLLIASAASFVLGMHLQRPSSN